MNQFCEIKGILRQFNVAKTPQQNEVDERRNRTLIEAARTMLADSKCLVTILNTIDHLGKFDGKADEGFFVGYSLNSKTFRVFNNRTRIVDENLHIRFSENTPNVVGSGPDWIFDIDALTRIMNYEPIVEGTQSNGFADPKSSHDDGSKPSSDGEKKVDEDLRKESECNDQEKEDNVNITNNVNAAGTNKVNGVGGKTRIELSFDPNMPALEDYSIFDFSRDDEDDGSEEPKNVIHTLKDPSWIESMQKELLQFKLQEVWTLVDLPNGKRVIGSKWVSRNKKDEREIVIRNKARLVAQGYTQEEETDYDEVFAPIQTFLIKYTSLKKHCMNYIKLLELVYVDDIIFGSTKKEICIAFEKLMHEKFQMSSMGELTFFLGLQVKQKKDGICRILVILRSTKNNKSMIGSLMYLTSSRPDIMYLKGQPKLGLWYPKDSPFDLVAYIDSYYAGARLDRKSRTGGKAKKSVKLMMEKLFRMELELMMFWSTVVVKTINGEAQLHALVDGKKIIVTKASVKSDLQLADEEGVECLPNSTIFEQLALMGYEKVSQKLTFYKPFFSQQWKFLIHTILQCLNPKTTTWNEFSSTMAFAIICLATNKKFNFSKFIFESMIRNLDNLSGKFLMYPRFVQVFLDQQLDGMSTHKRIYISPFHTKKIFGNMRRVGKGFSGRVTPLFQKIVVQNQLQLGKGSTILTDPHYTPTFIQPSPKPQKTQQPRKPKRKDTQVPQPSDPIENVADKAVHKELGDNLVRAATTASSLEAKQESGGGPKCQETMRDTIAQTRRVKKLEKKTRSRTHKLKRLYKVGLTTRVEFSDNEESLGEDASKQGRIDDIDADEEITMVSVQNMDEEMFDVNVLDGEEVFVAEQEVAVKDVSNVVSTVGDATTVNSATTTTSIITTVDDITLAQALMEIKSTKPKEKGVVIQDLGESTTTISSQQSHDNGKGILIEPVKLMKKKDLIRFDEEVALKLQGKFDEEERLAREKAKKEKEAIIALIETWDDIHVKIDTDHQLAERLQAQEQEELFIKEKAILF
ncbi:retrovirus-related pol polyprotein from transposon TNT 1-94 [Tanacetum coccineum]